MVSISSNTIKNNSNTSNNIINNKQIANQARKFIGTSDSGSMIDSLFDYYGGKVFYKGWILTYEDVNNDFLSSIKQIGDASNFLNKKWLCKYAVVSKAHKCMILYDYEPTNEIISYNFDYFITSNKLNYVSPNHNYNHLGIPDKHYRLDNQINYETLANFWNKKSLDFDYDSKKTENIENQQPIDDNFSIHSNGTTFRFAGLFFKKDRSKHSSLKRAKSGIQLERKKLNQLKQDADGSPTRRTDEYQDLDETRKSIYSPMRPSRSHESLASPQINNSNFPSKSATVKTTPNKYNQRSQLNKLNNITNPQILDSLLGFNLSSNNQSSSSLFINLNPIHKSLLSQENCFELKCYSNKISILKDEDEKQIEVQNSPQNSNFNQKNLKYSNTELQFSTHYFMCRSQEERLKWLQCLKNVYNPNESLSLMRHQDNTLQMTILEAKGVNIVPKTNRKYFCEIYMNNNCLTARTSLKDKSEILFWGENFEFNNVNSDFVRVDLYQQTISDLTSSQNKKNKSSSSKNKENNNNSTNLVLLGSLNIPLNSSENINSQPIEKWYKLEPLSCFSNNNNNNENIGSNSTQSFGKDSLTIRVKSKYQSLEILPLTCYKRLLNYVRDNYLILLLKLESHLNVRTKDDLSNSLVKIFHKLNLQTGFLSDLVLSEVLKLEDPSLTFRGNSLATKAMESYMKLVGDSYLKHTLSDCIRSIIETNYDLEIDPSKVTNQSSLQANREELVHILHLVCGRIFNSCVNFPIELKRVFTRLRHECKMNGKTDEMCDNLISACVFLRFICPAILSPNLFNLTQEYPEEKAARKLTLAAKTLQTIANFSKFGSKEFYMSFDKMNSFVDEHTILMREFLRNISNLNNDEEISPKRTILNYQKASNFYNDNNNSSNLANNQINETNFELDLIDIGKQSCILNCILVTIFDGFDQDTISKFGPEITEILNELNDLKLNNFSNNNLYLYENPLHQALIKKNEQQFSSSKNRSDNNSVDHQPSTNYEDLNKLRINHSQNENQNYVTKSSEINNNKMENEINLLKLRLRETEISLKKEQREKSLIEFKLKQQQQDNDQQMRQIINRLIKVEEELRKEQAEMQKLLRIKQDLIEIQNKRIDSLTKATSNNYLNTSLQQLNHNKMNNNFLQPKIINNSNKIKQFSIINPLPTSLSNPALNNNQQSSKPNSENSSLNSKESTPPIETINLNEKVQIAASPSSSSSSMTQFCNYLAANMINPQLENNNRKIVTSINTHNLHNNQLNMNSRKKSQTTQSIPSSLTSSSLTNNNTNNANNAFYSSASSNNSSNNSNIAYNSNYYLRTSEL